MTYLTHIEFRRQRAQQNHSTYTSLYTHIEEFKHSPNEGSEGKGPKRLASALRSDASTRASPPAHTPLVDVAAHILRCRRRSPRTRSATLRQGSAHARSF